MSGRKNLFLVSFKEELARLFFICFGVFLFILFFQPFPLQTLDYNNRLLFVTGFGAITFILACFTFILLPILLPKWVNISEWESGPPTILSLILLVLTVTSFAFYIRYVGKSPLTLYIMFKIILVCLLPIIIIIFLFKNKSLEHRIKNLEELNLNFQLQLKDYEIDSEEEEISLASDTKSDNLTLQFKNIVFIKSADNYIEVYFHENDTIEKKLIRSTLRNIELQLINKKIFIRCHRTSIVNIRFIEKLAHSYTGYTLKIKGYNEAIPVSRQYIVQIKKAIADLP